MPLNLTRTQVLKATTNSPFTRDFRHLLPFPRHWRVRQSFQQQIVKSVRPSDRIKYWNIVPGDTIADRKDPKKQLQEVLSINKLSNRVFLKGSGHETADTKESGRTRQGRSLHYSRCQLYLGEETFKHGSGLVSKPVFAVRVGTTNKRWDSFRKRYTWERFTSAVWPKLPRNSDLAKKIKEKSRIAWPNPERRTTLQANPLLDTPKSVVAEITYKPPPLPTSITAPAPKPALESAYINSLFNPSPIPFDESQPMDVHLVKELSNPHSRAKKQARWQQFQRYKVNLRKEMVSKELKNLKGRNARDATAEAMYKWRQVIEDEKKAKQKARWMTKERVAKFERKNKSKQKKTRRQNERLRDLVLADAPNQVLPKLQQTSPARVS